MNLDLTRTADWLLAVERWEQGDPRTAAEFVRRHGVQDDREREGIARMLTTKPDARRVKRDTKLMQTNLEMRLQLRRHDELAGVPIPPLESVFEAVARDFGVTVEAVKKMRQRHR